MSQITPNAAPPQGGDIMKMFEGPSADTLDDKQRATVAAIRGAFRELEKLIKNVHLYGESHSGVDRFRASFFETISKTITAQGGQIEFKVAPYEFTVFEQSVLENPSPERNFIYKLHLDGVNRFIFSEGLTREELDLFVSVLLIDWEDPAYFEDDTVTMMWEADFTHLDYVVVDSFSEDAKEGEEHLYTVRGVVKQVREGAVFSPAEGARDHRAERSARSISRNSGLSEPDLDRFEEVPFAMDEAEFTQLGTLIGTTGRETLEKFLEILFKVNLSDIGETHGVSAQAERQGRVALLFDRIADLLLNSGRVGDLERLMRKVRRLSGPHGAPIRQNVLAIEHLFHHWSTETFVARMVEELNRPETTEVASTLAILGLLNRPAAPIIAEAVGRVQIPERRRALLARLPRLVRGQVGRVARLLDHVRGQHGHELLKVIQMVGGPDDLRIALRAALRNKDADVRSEALSILPIAEAAAYLPQLYQALKDPAKIVRGKALHLLARMPTPKVHQHILQQIKAPDFAATVPDLDEKRRYFAAASITGNANPYFLELFQSGGLIHRKALDEQRHCAAVALGVRLCTDAVPAMEKELQRRLKSDLVVDACRWALAHRTAAREERTRQIYDIFFLGVLSGAADV